MADNFLLFLLAISGAILASITGTIPGMHVNNLISILIPLFPILSRELGIEGLAVFIVSMAVAHTFVNTIPSTYLGAPDPSTGSILPAHRLLLMGRGHMAVVLTLAGSIISLILSLMILPMFMLVLPRLSQIIERNTSIVLSGILLFLIASERSYYRRIYAMFIVLLSGILGIYVLDLGFLDQDTALFPSFVGLFTAPTIIHSVLTSGKVPRQIIRVRTRRKELMRGSLAGTVAGIISGVIPGVSPSIAAGLIRKSRNEREYLVTIGGINTAEAMYAMVMLYLLGATRSGPAAALKSIFRDFSGDLFVVLIGTALVSGGLATILAMFLSRKFSSFVEKINYRLVAISVLFGLSSAIFLISGVKGILVEITALGIGILPIYFGCRRGSCMGFLLVPIAMRSLGLNELILPVFN